MNFIDTVEKRQTLSTEELLNELSQRLDLDGDNQLVFSALGMVMLAHSGDARRRHDSCVNHILRVTLLSADLTENATKAILLGLLHDVVEDYPEYIIGPVENLWTHIENEYGKEISLALDALTNPPEVEVEEKEDHHTPVLYHKHIEHTLSNPDAAIIKLADFTDNLMTVALSDEAEWREDLKRRYFPVIPLFKEKFKDSTVVKSEDVNAYFVYIEKLL